MMTIEQFVVGSILIIIVTSWSIWQWLFLPRLNEVEERFHKAQARAETAEDILRNDDSEGMKLVGDHDWGNAMSFLDADEWGKT